MKLHVVLAASLACALVACTNGPGGPAGPTVPPFGTDPSGSHGAEPTGRGPEPGVSGLDPTPGGGPGNTVADLCAFDCARIEMACPGASSSNCVSGCTGDFTTIPVACSDLAFEFLRCVATEPLSCVNGDISFPTCETALLYLSYCLSSVSPPPTTGGGTPTGG